MTGLMLRPKPDLLVSTVGCALWPRSARKHVANLLGHESGEWLEASSPFRMARRIIFLSCLVLRTRSLPRHEWGDPLSLNAFGVNQGWPGMIIVKESKTDY